MSSLDFKLRISATVQFYVGKALFATNIDDLPLRGLRNLPSDVQFNITSAIRDDFMNGFSSKQPSCN